ncbi:hypothetical protein BDV25DRAFT_165626 [Aspergillus avenaceus]|uniref:DUF2470 domain-containing protein n=1 Tax=Aspergillus avenaceus TaxID=36643 RepID=A0A5N6TF38_ASPAV|nr:hypothetical protein BDV25DRAFT_165626 [Aspergillus avenaceus]
MAASKEDKSVSSKNFIISHMNADHRGSLAMYLRVYCNVPTGVAKSAQLEDISLSDLLISAKGTRYSVPLDPPMKSLSDTRSRVVAMHKDCLQRLGLSDIVVKEYRGPQGAEMIGFALVLVTLVVFCRRSNFLPGSLFYDTVGLDQFPSFSQFCYTVQPLLLLALFGTHCVEAVLFAVKRLKPHGVPIFTGVWFAWTATVIIEGAVAWRRFKRVVNDERERKEHRK